MFLELSLQMSMWSRRLPHIYSGDSPRQAWMVAKVTSYARCDGPMPHFILRYLAIDICARQRPRDQ